MWSVLLSKSDLHLVCNTELFIKQTEVVITGIRIRINNPGYAPAYAYTLLFFLLENDPQYWSMVYVGGT